MQKYRTKTKYKLHKEYHPRHHNTLIPQGVSKQEIELSNAIALDFPSIPIYRSNRQILHGRELDIFIPSMKLAVEFDGLVYHNSSSKSKYYHLWKTIECEKQGIQLIHIFSDEWELKKPLVIDLIRKTLGKYSIIKAEDCILNKISKAEGHNFIENSDIRGDSILSNEYLGLFYSNELLAVLSYFEENNEIVITRYSERRLIRIENGLDKFLSLFNNKVIITHLDRRFFDGSDFLKSGFSKIESTEPNIWYTKDFKSKIESNILKLSESEAKDKGYIAINDCGNLILKRQPKN